MVQILTLLTLTLLQPFKNIKLFLKGLLNTTVHFKNVFFFFFFLPTLHLNKVFNLLFSKNSWLEEKLNMIYDYVCPIIIIVFLQKIHSHLFALRKLVLVEKHMF